MTNIMNTIKASLSSNILRGFVLSIVLLGTCLVGNVYAADPAFNILGNDLQTLMLENRTTNPASTDNAAATNWRDPISASGGDSVSFNVYYHNGVEGTTANNVRLRIAYPAAASSTIVSTGYIISDNATQVSDTGTINVSSAQTLTFENTAYWYPNQTTSNPTPIAVTNTGTYVEVNIGNVAGGWPSQGNVVFRANLSNVNPNPSVNPTVDAGSNRDISESQSITLNGSATDPNSLAMTYSWTCNGGSLSNDTVLNPTYNAPSVSSDTVYSCTLTARNVNGNTGSDSVAITVRNIGGSSGGDTGGGGPTISVSLSANPGTSTAVPLNGVDLTATLSTSGISYQAPVTYRFDCENNNSYELRVETTARSYTAHDLCNYQYEGTYTPKVLVEVGGYSASNQINLTVGYIPGGGFYGISVDAGPSKDIGENQSTILNGYAFNQYGYALTYYWTCNGGSIANSSTISPTYYAPTVSNDTVYTCTMYATDTRGYKNSDSVNITVRNTGYSTSSGLSVTTNNPENVTSSTASLKGTLNNDGGQYASVRFNWGRLSSYSNYTTWMYNKRSGESFLANLSGLEKGKAYHYRIEASNGKEVVVGQDVAFVTKPDQPTSFTAYANGSSQINLNWNIGAASCYTMVTRKAGSYPLNSGDGTIVYYGKGSSYVDKNLVPGTWYYYRAWSVACDEGLNSFSESQYARAYTLAGTTYVPNNTVTTVLESEINVDAWVRNFTQNETVWQESINSNPNDEIEFKVIIIPTGEKGLSNVVLKNIISDKIESINSVDVNGQAYTGSISEMKLGNIALGESKVVTFKGKIVSLENLSYGTNELKNTIEVSATGNETASKTLVISVLRPMDASASLANFLNLRFYAGLMTILFIILCLVMFYLLIERKKGKECLVEKEGETKINKSKYFNIK